jgi:hypothetical protein
MDRRGLQLVRPSTPSPGQLRKGPTAGAAHDTPPWKAPVARLQSDRHSTSPHGRLQSGAVTGKVLNKPSWTTPEGDPRRTSPRQDPLDCSGRGHRAERLATALLCTTPVKGISWTGPKGAPSVQLRRRTQVGAARDSPPVDDSGEKHQLDRTKTGPPSVLLRRRTQVGAARDSLPLDGSGGGHQLVRTEKGPLRSAPDADLGRSGQRQLPSGRLRLRASVGQDRKSPLRSAQEEDLGRSGPQCPPLDGSGEGQQLDRSEKSPLRSAPVEDHDWRGPRQPHSGRLQWRASVGQDRKGPPPFGSGGGHRFDRPPPPPLDNSGGVPTAGPVRTPPGRLRREDPSRTGPRRAPS